MLHVSFTDLELWALWELAKGRQQAKGENVRDKRSDTSIDNTEMHYIGLKGEYAVSCYLDVSFDMEARPHGARWGDMLYRRKTVEVKVLQRDLIFNQSRFVSDIAVLVIPDRRSPVDTRVKKAAHRHRDVIIAGWTTRKCFYDNCTIHDFGYGDRQVFPAILLTPMERLKENGDF